MDPLILGIVLSWALVLGFGFVLYRLGSQLFVGNGRLLTRIEEMEKAMEDLQKAIAPQLTPTPVERLPIGAVAPSFDLPDLNDGMRRVTLEQFRGTPLLLMFFGPGCVYCRKMAPQLAGIPFDGSGGRPKLAIITSATAEANAELAKEFNLRLPFLLDSEAGEVGQVYRADGTPEAYLIDEEGKIASELVIGADPIFELAKPRKSNRKEKKPVLVGGNGKHPAGAQVIEG